MGVSTVIVNLVSREKPVVILEGDFFLGETQRRISGLWNCYYRNDKIYLENDKEFVLVDDKVVLYPLYPDGCGFILEDANGEENFYRGKIILSEEKGKINVSNEVDLEFFVRSILCRWFPVNDQLEFLKVMAMVVRTNSMIFFNRHPYEKTPDEFLDADFFNIEPSYLQNYYKGLSKRCNLKTHEAVALTEGMVLTVNDQLFKCDQSVCCGGLFSEISLEEDEQEKVIPDRFVGGSLNLSDNDKFDAFVLSDGEYLCNINDPSIINQLLKNKVNSSNDNYRWNKVFDIVTLLKSDVFGDVKPGEVFDINVLKRASSGKVLEISLLLNDGSSHSFGSDTVLKLKKQLELPSLSFNIKGHIAASDAPKLFTFNGLGRGQGGGMCQMGALQLAIQNYSYEEIISKYYPGVIHEKYY